MVAFHVSEEEDKEIALGNHRRRPQAFSLTGTQPHVGSWRLLAWNDLAPQSEQASTDAVIHAVPRPSFAVDVFRVADLHMSSSIWLMT